MYTPRERFFSMSYFTSQITTTAGAGPGQCQDPGSPSQTPTGCQGLEPSSAACQGSLAGTGMGSGTAGTRIRIHAECWHGRQGLNPWCQNATLRSYYCGWL